MTVLFVASGCGDGPTEHTPGGDLQVQISLINGDANIGQPIHLFGPDETFPCCQVQPLTERTIFVTVKAGDKITFKAGRNGNILKTVQCTANTSSGKVVKWIPTANGADTGTLACQTNW